MKVWLMMAFILGSSAFGSEENTKLQAPDFKVSVQAGTLVAEPPAGHHFNVKAPMALQAASPKDGKDEKTKPASPAPDKVSFPLTVPPGDLLVSLYLCDDKNTFCELHRQKLRWDGKAVNSVGKPSATDAASGKKTTQTGIDEHGFIVNQPELAIEKAQQEKKPLLIDFFGIWCPPCNELDELVFDSPEFKKQAANFVKLKLDADASVSWAFKSRFKVLGYPTLVFATPELDEITRLVGYRPKNLVAAAVKSAYDARTESFTQLKAKADGGEATASGKVGMIYLNRGEWEPARDYLKNDPNNRENYLQAEIEIVDAEHDWKKLIPALERGILEFPRSPDSVDRRVRLANVYGEIDDPAKKNQTLHEAIASARALLATPERLSNYDLTIGDLWTVIAEAQQELGEPEEAKKSWGEAAKEYGKYATSDKERGYNLERAACLWRAGENEQADKLYTVLEKHYPEEFTFFFNHARMKMEEKKFPEASDLARKALYFSYGDNRLRVANLLADSLRLQGKKDEARTVIQAALKSASLPEDEEIRTHRYYKALKDLEKKLNQSS